MPAYLIVDDSPPIRLLLAQSIRRAREQHMGSPDTVEIVEAGDVTSAFEEFRKRTYHAIFIDLDLGKGSSGLELLRAMFAERPEARIIVVTGFAKDHPEVVHATKEGAFAYLAKPFRLADVAEILSHIEVEGGRLRRIR